MTGEEKIKAVNIEDEMKTAYIDYSMSVIVSRALPDVRDGLKPVHRRVLFGMDGLSLGSGKTYKKSARIVGEVLGKYHPHGDTSVYDAMVRMAQIWSLRYPLVEGQGNFGSIDGDSPAAMRYTEARLMKIAEDVMGDMDKDTVDFRLNFDDTIEEPTVMPSRIPLLLVNGASGIAVGMATNMPPHNLTEVINAACAYIDDPDIDIEELIKFVHGPDFPTGAIIYGIQGIKDAYRSGKGRVVIRSATEIEQTDTGRTRIIITETPYLVNKAEMIKKIADLINEKKIEGISYINDESDRHGTRVVIILKRDAVANVVLNNLFKQTALQSSFSINNIALVDGRPRLLNLKDLIKYFIKHRHEVVVRRTRYELDQAQKRAHILEGLLIAIDNIDEVITIIRAAQTPDEAREKLMERFNLSDLQARAIIDMRLRSLTGLERDKVKDEHAELMKLINYYNSVLQDQVLQMKIIKDELLDVKEKYGDARRTLIIPDAEEFNPEDFYADEDVVITISKLGYIKRTVLSEYRLQARGGIGAKGVAARDEDFIEHLFIASMHNTMLFFTEKGKCFWLKVYEIPEGNKASKGRAIQNLINIEPDDQVKAYINVKTLTDPEYVSKKFIILGTKRGIIKKTSLEAYSRPRQNGVIALTVRDGDQLLEACLTDGNCHMMLAAHNGKAIKFHESIVRAIGRTSGGVRGISIDPSDEVIGMVCVKETDKVDILVVSEKGYGKRSNFDDYRTTNRGGKGVKTINITEKTGKLIAIKPVTDENDLMIINKSGITIRLAVSDVRVAGRATQGVRLINLRKDDTIAAVAKVDADDENLNIDEPNIEEVQDENEN